MQRVDYCARGKEQGTIGFIPKNKQEAAHIGIQVLNRSEFDPQAIPSFLQNLPTSRVVLTCC